MPNYRLAGQKDFLQMQGEISEICLQMAIADATSNPTLTRIKQVINDSYREICSEQPWWFLINNTSTFDTIASQTDPYALDDTCDSVVQMSIENKQRYLIKMEYENWRKQYPWGFTGQGLQIPIWYINAPTAFNNAQQVLLYPAADAVYTITYVFKRRVFEMSDDTDQPLIPPEFQDVIVARACWNIFRHRNDNRAEQWRVDYERRYAKMWKRNEEESMEFKRDSGGSVARLIQPYNSTLNQGM